MIILRTEDATAPHLMLLIPEPSQAHRPAPILSPSVRPVPPGGMFGLVSSAWTYFRISLLVFVERKVGGSKLSVLES